MFGYYYFGQQYFGEAPFLVTDWRLTDNKPWQPKHGKKWYNKNTTKPNWQNKRSPYIIGDGDE